MSVLDETNFVEIRMVFRHTPIGAAKPTDPDHEFLRRLRTRTLDLMRGVSLVVGPIPVRMVMRKGGLFGIKVSKWSPRKTEESEDGNAKSRQIPGGSDSVG